MIGHVPMIIVVLLSGLAAAGLVDGPPARVRRLARAGGVSAHRLGWPGRSRGSPALTRFLTARPDSLSLPTRCMIGGTAGVVVVLFCQAMLGAPPVSWLIGPAVTVAMVTLLGRLESPEAQRRRLQMISDLPYRLELIAAAMAAGLPLRGAIQEVVSLSDGPLTDDLAGVLTSIDLGTPDVEAWRSLHDHPALGRVSVDLARSIESGTMVVDTLRRHAVVARRRRRGMLEAQAKTVGVKSVPPLVFCFVPAFLLVSIVPAAASALQEAIF